MAKVVMLIEIDIPNDHMPLIGPPRGAGRYNWHLFKDHAMVAWVHWSGVQRVEIKRIYAEDGQIFDINEVVNKP